MGKGIMINARAYIVKSELGTRVGSDLAKNGRHFSPFPERGHTDFSLFTSKSVFPRVFSGVAKYKPAIPTKK